MHETLASLLPVWLLGAPLLLGIAELLRTPKLPPEQPLVRRAVSTSPSPIPS